MMRGGDPVADGERSPQAREALARHAEALRQLRALGAELRRLERRQEPPEAIAEARRKMRVAEAVERLAYQEALRIAGHVPDGEMEPPDSPDVEEPPTGPDYRRRDTFRWWRPRAVAIATFIGVCGGFGGVTVAAADAGPGSPLWPVTKVMYANMATERQACADAEAALANAHQALADGRLAAATRHLDTAARHTDKAAADDAGKLRARINQMRSLLAKQNPDEASPGPEQPPVSAPPEQSPTPEPSPTPTPAPGAPEPAPGAPEPTPGAPEPSPDPSDDPPTDGTDGDSDDGSDEDGKADNKGKKGKPRPSRAEQSDRGKPPPAAERSRGKA